MRSLRLVVLTLLVVAASALPARADVTAFIGAMSSPTTRTTYGASAGAGLLILGFEFEYAQAHADDNCFTSTEACTPSVRTAMFNVLVQTPRGIVPRMQLYATVGGGYFRERFESLDVEHTGAGTNFGGGAKIDLTGPIRLRVDYRIFKLGSDAVYSHPQRISAGLNVAF